MATQVQTTGERSETMRRDARNALILAVPFLLITVEGMVTQTSIITPLNPVILWTVRAMALPLTLWSLFYIWRTRPEAFNPMPLYKKVLLTLFAPLFCVAALEYTAWRVYDWVAFGLSDAPFETRHYPIVNTSFADNGRRHTVSINPFDQDFATDIPLPRWQREQIRIDQKGICVAVLQRTSPSGVIEIVTKGSFTAFAPPPLDIRNCADFTK
jgi:hypothetical protein